MKIAGTDFLPVVQRELREGARRPFNYWLRVAGASAGVLLLYSINRSADGNQAAEGLRLFTGLHEMLLVLICVMLPAMSADCIAREKREGTLGLLFLTPLTAMGIVVGKVVVQAFRAFTLWLAVLPVIIIPLVTGGVTLGDVASAVTIEFCVTLLCLAAGILASTLAGARSTAFILAACFGVAFVCLFGGLLGLGFFWQTRGPGQPVHLTLMMRSGRSLITGQSDGSIVIAKPAGPMSAPRGRVAISMGTTVRVRTWVNGRPIYTLMGAPPMSSFASPPVVQPSSGWSAYFSAPATRDAWRALLLQSWLGVPLLFLLILRFAARQMDDSWHDQPPSLQRENWIKTYCVPLARERFARQMRATLEWNPIAWLQQYSRQARLSKWTLCLGFVALECAANATSATGMMDAQFLMLLIFAAAYTFVGINGFLTEKQSGALELLLVTPMSPNQIIWGRVWGLWQQFLPAGATLLLLWLFAHCLNPFPINSWGLYPVPESGGIIWRLVASPISGVFTGPYLSNPRLIDIASVPIFVITIGFLTLPVFATYFALRVKNLIMAAVLTWLALFLCPYFAFTALAFLAGSFHTDLPQASLYAAVFLSNLTFALLACFLLRHSLSRRIYSF